MRIDVNGHAQGMAQEHIQSDPGVPHICGGVVGTGAYPIGSLFLDLGMGYGQYRCHGKSRVLHINPNTSRMS
jgi:hypothetical protein